MVEADIDVLKNQARPRLASRFLLPLYLWLSLIVFSCSNWGHSPYDITTRFRIGVDLEVIFFVDLQNTLLEAHARSLSSLKMYTTMMKRVGYGYNVEMIITQMCLDDLMSKMMFIGHMPKSYD